MTHYMPIAASEHKKVAELKSDQGGFMHPMQKYSSTIAICCPLLVLVSLAWHVPGANGSDDFCEIADFCAAAKLSLASAVNAAQAEGRAGVPFKAAISRRRPTHAFEVELLTGDDKVIRIEVDAICGEHLAREEERRTVAEIRELRRLIRRSRVGLADAIDAAARRTNGVAVRAELRAVDQRVSAAIGLFLHDAETEIMIERVVKDADCQNELLVSNDNHYTPQ